MPRDRTRDLGDQIRRAGLRATPTRVAVLGLLETATQPVSHSEAVAKLRDKAKDHVTVFRALTDLTRVGLARRIDVGDRMWRFEADRHDMVSHPHFVCASCGVILCLFDVDIALPKRDVPRSVKKQEVQVLLRGRCDDCEAS